MLGRGLGCPVIPREEQRLEEAKSSRQHDKLVGQAQEPSRRKEVDQVPSVLTEATVQEKEQVARAVGDDVERLQPRRPLISQLRLSAVLAPTLPPSPRQRRIRTLYCTFQILLLYPLVLHIYCHRRTAVAIQEQGTSHLYRCILEC